MIVLKFGGTSIGSVSRIKKVAKLITTDEPKLIVLSAMSGTTNELAEIANVPRSRSYDVLESLEKKGFIMMKVGKPIQYLAIKPDQVVERVQKKVHEDADFHLNQLEKLREELESLSKSLKITYLDKSGIW